MRTQVSLECPAKVNLSLRVHGRRADGYHAISTVLQTIALCDRLTATRIEPEAPLHLDVPGGGAPADDSNLVLAAARTFFGAIGEPARGVRFELRKRIPAGSGLGGGSSDAAGTLLALQELWGEPLSPDGLHAAAATVGSDVPFFLVGGTVLATGRGEQLRILEDVAAAPVIVAVPAMEVSTAAVYNHWSGLGGREAELRDDELLPPQSMRRETVRWLRGNDLEPVVRRLHPEVDCLVVALCALALDESDRGPQLSGAGGAVFGVGDWKDAEDAVAGQNVRLFRTSTRAGHSRP
ncbi:MAG: 4-(cytidine 5'-diphospho)-2-C-methyl-D-erythritol kinase [Acidobacteria bacterium]|nr:4-(cytidine 5'-diphospho)-2-C-methyl-D-erythritol kinase [Acidobacteriota bacterium]